MCPVFPSVLCHPVFNRQSESSQTSSLPAQSPFVMLQFSHYCFGLLVVLFSGFSGCFSFTLSLVGKYASSGKLVYQCFFWASFLPGMSTDFLLSCKIVLFALQSSIVYSAMVSVWVKITKICSHKLLINGNSYVLTPTWLFTYSPTHLFEYIFVELKWLVYLLSTEN